jgi:sigma-B regulation protein RsbU (phosphoserine phosphatase)
LPRPIHCHGGKTEIIEATGLPLGLFEEADYDELTYEAHPGDIFVFFSDGILDARSRTGDLFGRERVEQIVSRCSSDTAQSVVDSIFAAVNEHASGVEAFDDQTVVALRVKSAPARKK